MTIEKDSDGENEPLSLLPPPSPLQVPKVCEAIGGGRLFDDSHHCPCDDLLGMTKLRA